ncbi:MAG: glycerate kinase [Sphaerochaetaceae bacterium]|nr:glycerate kinase [Sphaerochaetaceae bacterium]
MNFLIAVDSFKGTLTSLEIAELIKKHINLDHNNVDILATGDGGEGTVDSLMYATNGKKREIMVSGAFGGKVKSYYCLTDNVKTAIMEVALSSGVAMLNKEDLNPLKTTSYGLGETINDALDLGVKKLIIGIGGSSTNDGGAGMLQALGVKFYDKSNVLIKKMTGKTIGLVERIDMKQLNPKLKDVEIIVACDVNNPLLGPNGCTYIYSGQKGASKSMKAELESYMQHFSSVVERELGSDYKEVPGVGAAGGLGYGLKAFLNARLLSGLDVVSEATKLEERVKNSDIVITGEGSFDHQSLMGKAPIKIAEIGKKYNKKVIGVFALTTINSLPKFFDEIHSVVPTVATMKESLSNPIESLEKLIIEKIELN